MWPYVPIIPRLANEEALDGWFACAGARVEVIRRAQKNDSQRYARVKIAEDELASKALWHLSGCVFRGRRLVVQTDEPRSRKRISPLDGVQPGMGMSAVERANDDRLTDLGTVEEFAHFGH